MQYVQLKSGLVVPSFAFAEGRGRVPVGEIATTRDGRDITRGFVDGLPLLPPTDSVLRARGGGNHQIYDEVLRDDQVQACFQQRRLAVVGREWEVLPGGKKRQDKAAADFLREQLEHVRWDNATDKMLYGTFYGYAVAEAMYGRDGRFVTLEAVKVRKQRRFGFAPNGELRLLTTKHPDGEALPAKKFWTYATGGDNDDEPYGLGLAHWLYWPVFFKRNGLKFWLIFLEKFGQPTAKGTYPGGAQPDERKRLLDALEAIRTDSAIAIPEGMQVELIEAARNGTADYTMLHDRMNASIAKVILGQTLTTEAAGGQYKADVQMDVRKELTKADADLANYSFNWSVARWLTAWNFPNAQPPQVWRRMDDPEDTHKLAERDERLHGMGFRPTLAYITDHYGEGFEEKEPERPTADAGPQFAEDRNDELGAMAARLDSSTAPAMDEWLDDIRSAIDDAQSLEELRDTLLARYPDLDTAVFSEMMQQALAAAALAGRFDVLENR